MKRALTKSSIEKSRATAAAVEIYETTFEPFRKASTRSALPAMDGIPNPLFAEWLMGWPMGWTDLKPLATDKFQRWQHSHGVCCQQSDSNQPNK